MLHCDFETYSEVNLKQVGAYYYASHPSTEVLICCYAFDDGPVHTWVQGMPYPAEFMRRVADGEEFGAHNTEFEYCIWNYCFGKSFNDAVPPLAIEQLNCMAVRAAAAGLPRSLEVAGQALRLPMKKDKRGPALIAIFCKPRKPTKADPRTRILPGEDPVQFKEFCGYCETDVEVERAIHHAVPQLARFDQHAFTLNRVMNNRGVPLDVELVRKAIVIVNELQLRAKARARDITGGINPTQVDKLKAWLALNDVDLPNLQAKTIHRLLLNEGLQLTDELKEMLAIRLDAGKASTKKLQAMLRVAMRDARARGTVLFYGAHTGRDCIAEGTRVIVRDPKGGIRTRKIEHVRTSDMLWDGVEWVRHEGVVANGEKEVIEYDGVRATPSHHVWVNGDKVHLGAAAKTKARIDSSQPWAVYVLTFKNKKTYVGISSRPQRRLWSHLKSTSIGSPLYVHNAIRLHGIPSMRVSKWLPSKGAAQRHEMRTIHLLMSNDKRYGYNMTEGGEVGPGFSIETQRRASALGNAALQEKRKDPIWAARYSKNLSKSMLTSEAYKESRKTSAAKRKGRKCTPAELAHMRNIAPLGHAARRANMKPKPPKQYMPREEKNRLVAAGIKRFFATTTVEQRRAITAKARAAHKWRRRKKQSEVIKKAKPWEKIKCV